MDGESSEFDAEERNFFFFVGGGCDEERMGVLMELLLPLLLLPPNEFKRTEDQSVLCIVPVWNASKMILRNSSETRRRFESVHEAKTRFAKSLR